MKNDYEKQRLDIVRSFGGEKKKLLIHSCCAPCSSACIERLIDYFDITVYYYNPNIDCAGEYDKRAEEQGRFLQLAYHGDVSYVCEKYTPSEYYAAVQGMEKLSEGSERCFACYRLRLNKTCEYAAAHGIELTASTLSVSPYKNSERLNEIGLQCAAVNGVTWIPSDFKKLGGYGRSLELSKRYGLYRQNYCGCVFSKNEAEARRSAKPKD